MTIDKIYRAYNLLVEHGTITSVEFEPLLQVGATEHEQIDIDEIMELFSRWGLVSLKDGIDVITLQENGVQLLKEEIINLSLQQWRHGCIYGVWDPEQAEVFQKERNEISDKLDEAIDLLATIKGLRYVEFSTGKKVEAQK